jgi:hypothetical protein
VDEIGGIVSLLTMVGGRVVYADGPFAADEDKHPASGLLRCGAAPQRC